MHFQYNIFRQSLPKGATIVPVGYSVFHQDASACRSTEPRRELNRAHEGRVLGTGPSMVQREGYCPIYLFLMNRTYQIMSVLTHITCKNYVTTLCSSVFSVCDKIVTHFMCKQLNLFIFILKTVELVRYTKALQNILKPRCNIYKKILLLYLFHY